MTLVRTLYILFFAFDASILYTNFLNSGIFDIIHDTQSDAVKTPMEDTKTANAG